MKDRYELIVYTSAEKNYAEKVINFIEKGTKYFAHRLFKQQCLQKTGSYAFKYLDFLCRNRDIKDIIIVDNLVQNFALSLKNGIPIKDYKGENEDDELIHLAKYLRELETIYDVRSKIKDDFANFLLNRYNSI